MNQLDLLGRNFIIPLKCMASGDDAFLSKEQVELLFSNLLQITELNRKFQDDIRERVENWSPDQRIGDLLKSFGPFFKMYTTYVNNHELATKLLLTIDKQKSPFRQWVDQTMEKASIKDQMFSSLLILPIQRVPRYRQFPSCLSVFSQNWGFEQVCCRDLCHYHV